MTCGEGIESAWAEQNHAAGSTKEQSTGHQQDTLDDFNAYWNWSKLHRLRTLISWLVGLNILTYTHVFSKISSEPVQEMLESIARNQ